MSKRFSPFTGERYLVAEWEKENKYRLWYAMQTALDYPDCNIRIIFSGPNPIYLLYSPQALEEFLPLVPTKVDRWGHQIKHFGRMAAGAVDQIKSSKNWKSRRDTILHTIGINMASRYLPLMIDTLDQASEEWQVGQWINFTNEMTSITFDVITKILFGRDIRSKIGCIDYVKMNGEVVKLDLMHYFHELVEDLEGTSFKLINRVLPFLQKYNLTTEHKSLDTNLNTLWSVLEQFLQESQDKESVYHKILGKCEIQQILFKLRFVRFYL